MTDFMTGFIIKDPALQRLHIDWLTPKPVEKVIAYDLDC